MLGIEVEDLEIGNGEVTDENNEEGEVMRQDDGLKQEEFRPSDRNGDINNEKTKESKIVRHVDGFKQEEFMLQHDQIEENVTLSNENTHFKVDIKQKYPFKVRQHFVKSNNGLYECQHCEYAADKTSKISRHIATFHTEQSFKCYLCNFNSKDKYHLKRHVSAKHTGIRYDCDECDFQTAYSKDVKRHQMRKHPKFLPFECDQCDYRTRKKLHLSKHIKTHATG